MTSITRRPTGLSIYTFLIVNLIFISKLAIAAPLQESVDIQEFSGCYYNYNHYNEGDRISTNEPCLNCTCHNKMLMCYLRVCPFTKPIGHDCVVEEREDQCCPIITCPEVPVELSHHVEPGSELAVAEKYGCTINNRFYAEGAQVPSSPNKPCELCYCIKNRTSCLMQECTLHIDGCQPIYNKDSCCPVRYNCDHENGLLLDDLSTTTTIKPTPGYLLTTVSSLISADCYHNLSLYADGSQIKTNNSCENCYCMHGDIVCAVQKCEIPIMEVERKICKAGLPLDGECCPNNYICEDVIENETNGLIPEAIKEISHEDVELQKHIDKDTTYVGDVDTKEKIDSLDITTVAITEENVVTETIIPIIENEVNNNKHKHESQEVEIKTELPLTLSTDDATTQLQLEDIPLSIPGEGSCLIDGETYQNNTRVATSNECEEYCTCISSVVICKPVECDLPSSKNCSVGIESKFECCPVYICKEEQNTDSTETQTILDLEKINDIVELTTLSNSQSTSEIEDSHKLIPNEIPNSYTTSKYLIEDSTSTKSNIQLSGDESNDKKDKLTHTLAPTDVIENDFEGTRVSTSTKPDIQSSEKKMNEDKYEVTTLLAPTNAVEDHFEGSGLSHSNSAEDDELVPDMVDKVEATTLEYRKEIENIDHFTTISTPTEFSNNLSTGKTSMETTSATNIHTATTVPLSAEEYSQNNLTPNHPLTSDSEFEIQPTTIATNSFDSHEIDLQKQELSKDTLGSEQTTISVLADNRDEDLLSSEVNSTEGKIHSSQSENPIPLIKEENITIVPDSDNLFVKEDSVIEYVDSTETTTTKINPGFTLGAENSSYIKEYEEQTTFSSASEVFFTPVHTPDFKKTTTALPIKTDGHLYNNINNYGSDATTEHTDSSSEETFQTNKATESTPKENSEYTTISTNTMLSNDKHENVTADEKTSQILENKLHSDMTLGPFLLENELATESSIKSSPNSITEHSSGNINEDIIITTTDLSDESATLAAKPMKPIHFINTNLTEESSTLENYIEQIVTTLKTIATDQSNDVEMNSKERVESGTSKIDIDNLTTTSQEIDSKLSSENNQLEALTTTVTRIPSDLSNNISIAHKDILEVDFITTMTTADPAYIEESEEVKKHNIDSQILFEDSQVNGFPTTANSIESLPDFNVHSEDDKNYKTDSHLSSDDIKLEEYITTVKSIDQELTYNEENGEDEKHNSDSHLSFGGNNDEEFTTIKSNELVPNYEVESEEDKKHIIGSSDHNKPEEAITTEKSIDPSTHNEEIDEDNEHKTDLNLQSEYSQNGESPTTVKYIDSEDVAEENGNIDSNKFEDVITTAESIELDTKPEFLENTEIRRDETNSPLENRNFTKIEDYITTIKSIDVEPILDIENINENNIKEHDTSIKLEPETVVEEFTTVNSISSEPAYNVETENGSNTKLGIENSVEIESESNEPEGTTVKSIDSVQKVDAEHENAINLDSQPEMESNESDKSITTIRNFVLQPVNVENENAQKKTTDYKQSSQMEIDEYITTIRSVVLQPENEENENIKKNTTDSTQSPQMENDEYITTIRNVVLQQENVENENLQKKATYSTQSPQMENDEDITTIRNIILKQENVENENSQKKVTENDEYITTIRNILLQPENVENEITTESTQSPHVENVDNSVFELATSTDRSEDEVVNEIFTTMKTHILSYTEHEIDQNVEPVQVTTESTVPYNDEIYTTIRNENLSNENEVDSNILIDYKEPSTVVNPHIAEESSDMSTETPGSSAIEKESSQSNSNNSNKHPAMLSKENSTIAEIEKLGISTTPSTDGTFVPITEEKLHIKTDQQIYNVTHKDDRLSGKTDSITDTSTVSQNTDEDNLGNMEQPASSQNLEISDTIDEKIDITTTTERANHILEDTHTSDNEHNIYIEDSTTTKYQSVNEKPLNETHTTGNRVDSDDIQENLNKMNETTNNTTSSPIFNTKTTESIPYSTASSIQQSTYGSISQTGMYAPPQYSSYPEDEYTDEDEGEIFGPGTCRYGGKLYVSAQQIPRDDPCDFCFCFRSDIICLQQSCPPPISGCREEPIHGFCCPRYECPVSMGTVMNITTSTTTTSTTLPPHFLSHNYQGSATKSGCFINGVTYKIGDEITSSSGPCMQCLCGGDGQMKCSPKSCSPEPLMRQMVAQAISNKR